MSLRSPHVLVLLAVVVLVHASSCQRLLAGLARESVRADLEEAKRLHTWATPPSVPAYCAAVPPFDQHSQFLIFGPGTLFRLHETNRGFTRKTDDWYSDEWFGLQRLLGVFPNALQRIDDVPAEFTHEVDRLDSVIFRSFRDACKAGVIFGVKHHHNITADKYFRPHTFALFIAEPTAEFKPIVIRIDAYGLGEHFAFRNTNKYEHEKDDWPWRFAKLCFHNSEFLAHELGAHLGGTHLIMEAAIVATRRTLPYDHPVYQLLHNHFNVTLALNAGARETLVPQQIVVLTELAANQVYEETGRLINRTSFTDRYVPRDLKRRGLIDDDSPLTPIGTGRTRFKLPRYLYGEFALEWWFVIRKFAWRAVNVIYPTPDELVGDKFLDRWTLEMRVGIPGFPNMTSTAALADALTMFIYTASVQHAAVNYRQKNFMADTENVPTLMVRGPPSAGYEAVTEQDYEAALPPRNVRKLQAEVATVLSAPWSWWYVLEHFVPRVHQMDPTLETLAKMCKLQFVQSKTMAKPREACMHSLGIKYGELHLDLQDLNAYLNRRNDEVAADVSPKWRYDTIMPTNEYRGVPKSIII